MQRHEPTAMLEVPVSRRTIVVTGTRLAYATPIVAASFRLTELRAGAQDAISGLQRVAAQGLFPPVIESVSFVAPSWVHVAGRHLTDGVVTFSTNEGTIPGGFVQVNSDSGLTVSIPDGLTISSTRVETIDGVDVFDQTVEPPIEEEPASETSAVQVEDAPIEQQTVAEEPTEDAEPVAEESIEEAPIAEAPAKDVPVEEAAAEAAPVEPAPVEQAPVEQEPVEPVAEQAPVDEASVEETPPEDSPVEEEPVEEAPVEVPVEWMDLPVGTSVVVRGEGAKIFDAPSESSNIVMEFVDGSQVVIVGPKEDAEDRVWWPVQDPGSALVGYIWEHFLRILQ